MTREVKKYVFNREEFLKLTTLQERNEYVRYADLRYADVSYSDLTHAYVSYSDLDEAYVCRVDLNDARTKKTNVIVVKNHDLK